MSIVAVAHYHSLTLLVPPISEFLRKLQKFRPYRLSNKPSGPAAQQLRQLILELLWPSQLDSRNVTHGVSFHYQFQDWRLDSSRMRHIPNYVRTPLSSITLK